MIVFMADGSPCLVLQILTILALTMPSGAVHPIMPALGWRASMIAAGAIDAASVILDCLDASGNDKWGE